MTDIEKSGIIWFVFATGLILGIVGWATTAYSSWTGTIFFLVFMVVNIALWILWGFKK